MNKIIPKSIKKSIQEVLIKHDKQATIAIVKNEEDENFLRKDAPRLIKNLEKKMHAAAKNLEFEKAAELRDRVKRIREKDLSIKA
jgi:excinuclease ABC subunit B